MSTPRSGSAFPLHPDQYGTLGHELGADIEAELFGADALELTEAQYDALWAEEQQIRGLAEKHTHPGCGHECESDACHLFCATKDWNCEACERRIAADSSRWRARAANG